MNINSVMTAHADQVRRLSGKTGLMTIEAMTAALSGVELGGSTSRLPEGYTEVEYIEITDQQYVDTNFMPNQDTKLIINLQITDLSIDKNNLLGARTSTSQNAYAVSTTDGCWRHGYGTATTATTKAVDAEWHEITMDKNKFYVDGVLVNTGTYKSFTCPVNLTIGRINHTSTVYQGYARFGECKVYDNGVLARELIPAINVDTLEKGMYDILNGVFYKITGAGSDESDTQKVYSGTVIGGSNTSRTFDVGVELNDADELIVARANEDEAYTGGVMVSAIKNSQYNCCVAMESNTYGGVSTNIKSNAVTYSGTKVTITSNKSMGGTFAWYLIKA